MKLKKIQYFVIFVVTFFGCDNANEVISTSSKKMPPWIYLSIKANSSEYFLYQNEDSLFVKLSNTNDSIKPYKISPSEKDSLFKWTEKLIDSKSEPSRFCTDYFGKLILKISYSEQVTKEIMYTSICEWEKLDSNSNKIHNLVFKLKGSN